MNWALIKFTVALFPTQQNAIQEYKKVFLYNQIKNYNLKISNTLTVYFIVNITTDSKTTFQTLDCNN